MLELVVVGLEVQLLAAQGDVAVHIGDVGQGGDPGELRYLDGLVQGAVKEPFDLIVAHVTEIHVAEVGDIFEVVEGADDELVGVGLQGGLGFGRVLGGVAQLDAAEDLQPSLVSLLDLHHGGKGGVGVVGEVVQALHLGVDVEVVGEGDVFQPDLQGAAAHGVVGGGGVSVKGEAGVGVVVAKKHDVPLLCVSPRRRGFPRRWRRYCWL